MTLPQQQWRRQRGKWSEPICPFCHVVGIGLCGRCLRWCCHAHALHDCARIFVEVQ